MKSDRKKEKGKEKQGCLNRFVGESVCWCKSDSGSSAWWMRLDSYTGR